MAFKHIFYATIRDGKLNQMASKAIAGWLRDHEGKRIVVEIKVKRNTRSNNQNRYYWGVIVATLQQCILEEWGEEIGSEECHEMLKRECNYVERINESTGEVLRIPKSTAELTTTEAEEYYEKCRRWVKEFFNTMIPLPNTQAEMFYNTLD